MPKLLSDLLSGRSVSYLAMDAEVRAGFSVDALREMIDEDWLTIDEAERLIAPRRTLQRRLNGGDLTKEESNRLATLAKLFGLATKVFGTRGKAQRWLRSPLPVWYGRTALDLASTAFGVLEVEQSLHQIDHGMFA